MNKYGGIILGVLMALGGFFITDKARAADIPSQTIVINEVQYDPPQPGTDSNYEWFELYNKSSYDIILDGWTITDNNQTDQIPTFELKSKEYLVIAASEIGFQTNFVDLPANFIDLGQSIGGGLSNTGDRLILNDTNGVIDQISWGTDTLLNPSIPDFNQSHSLERKPAGLDTNSASDFIDQATPTPGMGIPQSVFLDNPEFDGEIVNLSWSDPEPNDLFNYELYLSENLGELGDKIDDSLSNFYELDGLALGSIYYFTVRKYNSDGVYSDSNQASIFLPIVYPKTIFINEICPHPQNGVENEFIELFNSGSEDIDLGGWVLDDVENSGSAPYEIPADTKIKAGGYIAFYKTQTKISLADNGDTARLLFPDDNLASSISYNEYASLGYSWARKSDGNWAWTTTSTFGLPNIFTLPPTEEKTETEEPINTVPIEIATGNFQDYLNKLVKVTGKVTSTSGNTFYLDDGSGEVKIYIQEKTGIDKPEMHKNDIFEVIGVVDLYGKTWRILPQKQEDIQLIEAAVKSSTAKTSAKKASSVIKSIGTAASVGPKKVEAASNSPPSENQEAKTPFWIQLIKALLGLTAILLIIFVIKLRQRPKEPTIGGHFGDDET